ncbi:hypothetical protein [Thermomonas aquatica]|uniref:Uncharacterized protein n=1 Tax=Thermomonas aquatica TaxID=2202149 RepID=A0A5B7ZP58_9GAMM|nr:hypothetical protein [Thermomonas aquatica]QDA56519.1 hypothetical protein FHQ07_03915 [Thermomonas aquatica]
MKNIAIISLVVACTGCVSSSELRTKTPTVVVTSTKEARAVAACITEAWEKGGVFGMTMPIENKFLADGYSVVYKNGQTVQLMADVHELESGSTTKYYKVSMVAGVSKFEKAVKDCQ